MFTFMAGATRMGARVASAMVDTRSSARPRASLASRFAVAGATIRSSAQSASAMWSISLSSREVEQLRRDALAAQGLEHERGDELAGGGRHRATHRAPGAGQRPNQLRGLVGRDAAAHGEKYAPPFHSLTWKNPL